MEYIAQAKDYWIAPQAVKITLNALGNPHRTQATVASGAVIMCYIKGVDGLEYDNGHQYRAWNISASPTYFNTATKKYVYAAIPRSSEVGVQAVIVYPSELLDIYGCNEDGDQVGSEHFYYIWLQGVISESAYNRANRYWQTDIDYGVLATDEARDDQSYNTDWYTFNAVTQTVTFLKEIIMKAGSSFRNLILGGHNLTGVATGDTPEDIDSDTLVVTPNYIRNKFLHKDRDDTTPYSLTIEQELRVGNRGIMNHLQSTDYTGDGMLDSGYKLWYEEGRAKLVIDDLVARGKFTVNELETRIWTYAGGNMVFSGAGSTIFFVEYLDANEQPLGYTYINQPWLLRGRALLAASLSWSKRRQIQRQLTDDEKAQVVKFRCYEFSDDGTMQTRNWWHPNDIAMCQTLNKVRDKINADGSYSGSASNTVYKRRIAGIGSKEIPMLNDGRVYDYVDLWNIYDLAGNSCKYKGTDGQEHLITDSVKGFLNMAPSGAAPSTDWPAAGDVIVQMGNPLDTDRQAAVTIEVQGDVHGFKVYDTIADYSMANKLWVEIGYDQTTGKAKANVYGDFRFGCRESEEAGGGSYIKYNRTSGQLDIRANVRFTSPTTQQETTLDNFASAVVGELGELQNQIDGEIDTWFYNGEPGPTVLPESEWVAADTQAGNNNERLKHLGDLYYDNSSGYAYRYSNSGTEQSPVFYWNPISDSAVIKALEDAAKAQDTADHKRRVFTAQPAPPYDAGDLWVNVTYPANYTGETDESQHKYKNEILKCITSKPLDTDTFSINDWSLSNGYTSKLNNFVTNTYAPFAQSIQTQVDKKAETYRQATNPASSWAEADKPSHVGDIWMDISANGGKKTYIYQNTAAAGQTPVYDWVAQEVPDEVFDEIDGKTAIYVGWNDWVVYNVSQLNDKDLFIPAADVTPTGSSVTYYANKVYRWDATNSTWNEVAYTDDTYAHGFDYLKAAMKGDTQIQGGLLLSNTIVLRNLNGTTPTDVMAGMNGILNTDLTDPKKSIAAWYGGDMVDLEDLTHYWTASQIAAWEAMTPSQKAASVLVAKSLDRFDGSGYRASGNISWNAAGDLTIKGQVVTATTKIDTPAIFLNGTDITATLNAILGMFELDTTTEPGTTLIKANYSLYSVGDVSALGNSSGGGGGGGGGGASVLYELNDVLANAGGTSVLDAQAGYVLTCVENGGSLKWKAAPTAPTYVLPQATSGALGGIKIGYTDATVGTRNYAVALDNDGKAYVNVPWTDTTYTLAGLMGSTAKGGTTQPIYWNGTEFKNTTYTLAKSVPANAVFTDHYDWSDITNKPSTFTPSAHTHDYIVPKSTITYGANYLQYDDVYATEASNPANAIGNPTADWYHHIVMNHANSGGYFVDMTICFHSDKFYYRRIANGVASDWVRVLDSSNSSVSKSGSTLTVKINGSSESITDTNTWRPLGTGASDACAGNDSRLSDSRPASDVYTWAKQSTKPSYDLDEVSDGTTRKLSNYLLLSGGTMTGLLKITTNSRTLTLGAQNSGAIHIYNDNNSTTFFNGGVSSNSNGSYDLGTTSYYWNCVYTNRIVAKTTTDASASAANNVALITGNPTGQHLEFDGNEIMSKGSGTTTSTLYLNAEGGTVSINESGGNCGIGNSSPSYKLHVSGDIYATGDVTAASDRRKKAFVEDIMLTLEQIANAPAVKFRWNDNRDNLVHIGTYAQYWQKVLPESVRDNDDNLGLGYGSTALVAVVNLAKYVLDLYHEVQEMKYNNYKSA